MNIAIVHDSSTGTTAGAAESMGRTLQGLGHQCQVQSVSRADPAQVVKADLICVGAWVKGMFVVGQHPSEGALKFIEGLSNLQGKRVVVFCTYKIAAGSTLPHMAQALQNKGATVVGQFKYRGPEPSSTFEQFARSLQ
jgi:flavodoxin